MTAPDATTKTATEPAPAARLVLRSTVFRKGREAGWRELEEMILNVEKRGFGALSPHQLQQLPVLYRAALSSLSVARSIALDRNLLLYLENLALRAFLVVYGPRQNLLRSVGEFFRRGFPGAVREARWHILISALCLAIGILAGFMLVEADQSWFFSLVPSFLAGGRGPATTRAEFLDQEIFAPWPGPAQALAVLATFLFQNNTVVGILAFTLGIAGGVPTLLLMVYQGLTLGAFLALHWDRGITVPFLGWISIHGVTELTAIVLCGAAGLVLGDKVLFPGRYGRIDNLAQHGRSAARIAIGAMVMLLLAAGLEGGLRQLVASTSWRFAVGGLTGLLWLSYFLLCGRNDRA
jgi:uncharacterized membrane protein SpoIIM required for sporulation